MGNAVTPILSYQLTSAQNFQSDEVVSPLASGFSDFALESHFSLASQVLVEDNNLPWSFEVRNWLPETAPPEPETTEAKIDTYSLSIPKLKIANAVVKIGVENLDKNLVHYPGTAIPGRSGVSVIFGHSVLPQFFNPTNYKTIFSTVPTLKENDQILIDYGDTRLVYLVQELKEVIPSDPAILAQRYDDSYLNLITCVPPGTFSRRLIVRARLSE